MKLRYIAVFSLFILLFFGIWTKLFYWQIVRAEELSAMGQEQYAMYLEIPPHRGEIKTSDGFSLVTNKISYLMYANPKEVKESNTIAQTLAPLVNTNSASISGQLSLNKMWVSLQTGIDNTIKDRIEKLNIPGIGFQETPRRDYPEASLAAQLIGFVGKDVAGNDAGYFGLEGFYDRQLKGRPGKTTIIHDAFGKPIIAKLVENSGQQDGRTLKLYLDRVIQYLLEQKLQEGIQTYGAQSGMAAVMDPKTGGILAMASFPSFDPRDFWKYDQATYKNPFITDTYEPGSTFKPLVMSAALDAGVVSPLTKCSLCGGPVKIADYELHTWDNKYFENTNMIDVIKHSDNTGMVFVSQKLGIDKMADYLQKFGIGTLTGIDLQGEFSPDMKPKDDWHAIDLATASFGQGISVTPMQLLDGFCSIANGGSRMEPHMVSEIQTASETIPIPPKELNHAISSTTSKMMTEMLVNAVNNGEAKWARLKGYRIAGKTGTASIPVNGHYDTTQTIASFVGFAPADDPKFCMFVILNRPSTSIYGAETAAPIFFDMARDILTYDGIGPTEGE